MFCSTNQSKAEASTSVFLHHIDIINSLSKHGKINIHVVLSNFNIGSLRCRRAPGTGCPRLRRVGVNCGLGFIRRKATTASTWIRNNLLHELPKVSASFHKLYIKRRIGDCKNDNWQECN